ncbi:MAG: hypothetical protein KKB81_01730 [Candidatus Margulisbacteria bacterium]|nr:hypothetical protein [Candidatus Margulisiibacteriota bacterium]MBU1021636.1 hypothetical protein [Candidatus Margulisiibacteriota bacterium]MBU1728786.1 hypothetical protein [Candidatus Margulisiibacteriota bacterium]MBU1955752.1 hypothetical protein [Candidatus Margulisiibacteriota bacterium]
MTTFDPVNTNSARSLIPRFERGTPDEQISRDEWGHHNDPDQFNSHDSNGDGKLNADEFLELINANRNITIYDIDGKPIGVVEEGVLTEVPPEANPAADEVDPDDTTADAGLLAAPGEASDNSTEIDALRKLYTLVSEGERVIIGGQAIDLPPMMMEAFGIRGTERDWVGKAKNFLETRGGEIYVRGDKLFKFLKHTTDIDDANLKVVEALFGNYDGQITAEDAILLDDFISIMRGKMIDLTTEGEYFGEWVTRRLQKFDYSELGNRLQALNFKALGPKAEQIYNLALLRTRESDKKATEPNWDYVAMYLMNNFFKSAKKSYNPTQKAVMMQIKWDDPLALQELVHEISSRDDAGEEITVSIIGSWLSEGELPSTRDLLYLLRASHGNVDATLEPVTVAESDTSAAEITASLVVGK